MLSARLDLSIPSAFFGQRGFIPAFGYGAPHSSARGTLTLMDNALLSARFLFADYPLVKPAWFSRHVFCHMMACSRAAANCSLFE
jgi:hypothetical protein